MQLPTKAKLLAGSAATVAILSVAAIAANQPASVGATDEPPIVTQVNDHETRITKLESDDAATQAQVSKNTADISGLQDKSASSGSTGVTTQAEPTSTTTQSSTTQASGTTSSTPTPAPTPTPDPRTITAVDDQPAGNGLHTCTYTLYSASQTARLGAFIQPDDKPCYAVGDVLPIEQ